ncbi:MAG TPA: phosphate ABC transporter ATP-binding protein [Acidimicrobiales bacterium]|nr:phosphate ABC transporter ATP-binding protein [Acidimicrobiales bacterium]
MSSETATGPAEHHVTARRSRRFSRPVRSVRATAPSEALPVHLQGVGVAFGKHEVVRDVTLELPANKVTALVGPSGCGKTSILRAINRMHDETGGTVTGRILVGDMDVYGGDVPAELLRGDVGMVFQRPNPFPTMSIFGNVVAGLRFTGIRDRKLLREAAESALRHAALWDSVKDRLDQPAIRLSGGQQQRLCIARALAVEPRVLLLDEPCSALDPQATAQIEELLGALAKELTIGLVTHNMFQARRVSDVTAVFLLDDDGVGTLVEQGPTAQVFDQPTDPRTKAYVAGDIG